jgi:membrane protein implicated in regulation of membrane protease activity
MFAGGALSAPVLGLIDDHTLMPLTATMGVFSLLSVVSYYMLVEREY